MYTSPLVRPIMSLFFMPPELWSPLRKLTAIMAWTYIMVTTKSITAPAPCLSPRAKCKSRLQSPYTAMKAPPSRKGPHRRSRAISADMSRLILSPFS